MTRMFVTGLLAIAACHSSSPAPATAPLPPLPASPIGLDRKVAAAEVGRLADLVDRYCACTDDDCRTLNDKALEQNGESEVHGDPLSDGHTWPPDLAAIAQASFMHLLACGLEQRTFPHAFALLGRHELDRLRTAACACTDMTCAEHARKTLAKAALSIGVMPADPETKTAIDGAVAATRVCIATVEGQQALLDMKALRTEGCACRDRACAQGVAAKSEAWRKDYQHTQIDDVGWHQLHDVADELAQCIRDAAAQH